MSKARAIRSSSHAYRRSHSYSRGVHWSSWGHQRQRNGSLPFSLGVHLRWRGVKGCLWGRLGCWLSIIAHQVSFFRDSRWIILWSQGWGKQPRPWKKKDPRANERTIPHMKHTASSLYAIDHINAAITVSKTFLKEAGVIGSDCYQEMLWHR